MLALCFNMDGKHFQIGAFQNDDVMLPLNTNPILRFQNFVQQSGQKTFDVFSAINTLFKFLQRTVDGARLFAVPG